MLNRVGVIEMDVPPEVFFGQQRPLEELIDEAIDKFVRESALNHMQPEGQG